MDKNFQQIHHFISGRISELVYWKEKVEVSLAKAPEGSLILSKSNGSTQFFHRTKPTQKKGVYLSKKNKKLIASLAQKDYDQLILKELEKELCQLHMIKNHLPASSLSDVYSKLSDQRKPFVTPYFISDEDYTKQWLAVKYESKPLSEELPFYITERGEKVRSKTEKILADKLSLLGVPYRYEYPLKLKGYGTVYPDFTLLDVAKRREIYWEHFGMMDNPQYAQKAIQKLHTYEKNGIYPGKNLIVTFETPQAPFDVRLTENMIAANMMTV